MPNLRCTKLCRLSFHGLECNDDVCPYAHSLDQLKSNAHDLVTYKTTVCKYFMNGNCFSKGNCRFAHSEQEIRSLTDHPRCNEIREQLKSRNRDIHHRRQKTRKEKEALAVPREKKEVPVEVVVCNVQPPSPPSTGNSSSSHTHGQERECSAIVIQIADGERSSCNNSTDQNRGNDCMGLLIARSHIHRRVVAVCEEGTSVN